MNQASNPASKLSQRWIPESSQTLLDGVLMVMPHIKSGWVDYLQEAIECVKSIIKMIVVDTPCVVIIPSDEHTRSSFHVLGDLASHPLVYPVCVDTNDTWARDFAPLSVRDRNGIKLLDFRFNGWGSKFKYDLDNKASLALKLHGIFAAPLESKSMILEGGSVESDGEILMTTTACLLHESRNPHLSQREIEEILKQEFGVKQILWLRHGYLSGDDTDSHIDNLARFIAPRTVAYIYCQDKEDEHYYDLALMEEELKAFRTLEGEALKLVPLPMCEPLYYDNERLPASYANFLILQNRILIPTYGSGRDQEAIALLQAHTTREVVGIDCRVLVRQHGSLHCMSMQFPRGALKLSKN